SLPKCLLSTRFNGFRSNFNREQQGITVTLLPALHSYRVTVGLIHFAMLHAFRVSQFMSDCQSQISFVDFLLAWKKEGHYNSWVLSLTQQAVPADHKTLTSVFNGDPCCFQLTGVKFVL